MAARFACVLLLSVMVTTSAAPVFAENKGRRYALLIGVKSYDHASLTPLKYPENDAEEMAATLRKAGYAEVVVLTVTRGKNDETLKPTATNIRTWLKALSERVKRDDLLLVGLSGHGLQWPVVDPKTKKETQESFFCPTDARPQNSRTLDELKKTMIPLGELFQELEESGAGVRLVLVDACRNDVKGESRNVDVDNLPRPSKGTAVLFSCKGGERAWETDKLSAKGHGVFFHHVIEGLQGKAKNKKGEVTWTALAEHVTEQVTVDVPKIIGGGAKQTPHEIKNIVGLSPLMVEPAASKAEQPGTVTKAKPTPPAANEEDERIYREGRDAYFGVSDLSRAFTCFRKVAKGHSLAQGWHGWMTCLGQGTPTDLPKGKTIIEGALPKVIASTEAGNLDAMCLLGVITLKGYGVTENQKEGARMLREAADRGHAYSMFLLGKRYLDGAGVDPNVHFAMMWFRKAADLRISGAIRSLGLIYSEGKYGIAKNNAVALRLFRDAANMGDPSAMNQMGIIYFDGRGVDKHHKDALLWFQRAADKGNVDGMIHLGNMYAKGQGMKQKQHPIEARKWYTKAAELGSEIAKQKIKELDEAQKKEAAPPKKKDKPKDKKK